MAPRSTTGTMQTVYVVLALFGLVVLAGGAVVGTTSATSFVSSRAVVAAVAGAVLAVWAIGGAVAPAGRRLIGASLAIVTVAALVFTVYSAIDLGTALRSSPTTPIGYNANMLNVIGIALTLYAIAIGVTKLDLGGYWQILLGLLELAVLVVGVIALGWLGLVVLLAINLVAIVVWSIRLAIRKESILTFAAIQADVDTGAMEDLFDQLMKERAFKHLGSIDTANLISYLSQRARGPSEIAAMAPPIAMLHAIHETDLESLTAKFDQLLRLYNKPAKESMALADTLTVATRSSAATFEDMLDAMISVALP